MKKNYLINRQINHNGKVFTEEDESIELSVEEAAPLLSFGAISEAKEVESPAPSTELMDAIAQLDADNKEHWTADGKPDIKALSAILARKVSADERDNAWSTAQLSSH